MPRATVFSVWSAQRLGAARLRHSPSVADLDRRTRLRHAHAFKFERLIARTHPQRYKSSPI